MQRKTTGDLLRQLARHLAMGMGLGMFLALCLIGGNFAGITAMIAQSAAPKLHLLLFLTMWTFLIGVGSACTGWIFIAVEQERRRSR